MAKQVSKTGQTNSILTFYDLQSDESTRESLLLVHLLLPFPSPSCKPVHPHVLLLPLTYVITFSSLLSVNSFTQSSRSILSSRIPRPPPSPPPPGPRRPRQARKSSGFPWNDGRGWSRRRGGSQIRIVAFLLLAYPGFIELLSASNSLLSLEFESS